MEYKLTSRLYSKREFNSIVSKMTYSILKRKKGLKLISKEFQTKIMLAVTQVNGCQICNYYHTKQAIDSGMSNDELQSIVLGDQNNVQADEAMALLFAQHYASEKGNYSKETFGKVIQQYGIEKAYGILGVVTMISFGNAYGICLGNFKSRFTKTGKIKNSKFINELYIILSVIILFPITFINNIFKRKDSKK